MLSPCCHGDGREGVEERYSAQRTFPEFEVVAAAILLLMDVATSSRSVSNRSAQVSSVMAAFLCPSMRWIALTLAPELIAMEAAVYRRSWQVSVGTPESRNALAYQPWFFADCSRRCPPDGAVNTKSSGPLPLHCSLMADITCWGTGTSRTSQVLGAPSK